MHHSKSLAWGKTNATRVLVPGCPYQDEPGSEGCLRGFWRVNTETWETKFIETKTPKFVTLAIKDNAYESSNLCEGNIVRVIPEHATPGSSLAILQEKLYQEGAAYVEMCPPLVGEGVDLFSAPRIAVLPQDDATVVLAKALQSGLLDLRGEAFEDLMRLGTDLLRELQDHHIGNDS